MGRKGERLNTEAVYRDPKGMYALNIKVHHAPYGKRIWTFHQKQFEAHKGLFEKTAKKINVNGLEAFYGISQRLFDGKGHKLNPPAKMYAVIWYDPEKNKEYEMIFRTNKPKSHDEKLFKSILKPFPKPRLPNEKICSFLSAGILQN